MKTTIHKAFIAAMLCFAASLQIHAQDTVVQVAADEAGLVPVSATALPRAGTFWVLNANGTAVPWPVLPPGNQNSPIYAIIGNSFLVDGTGGSVAINPLLAGKQGKSASVNAALESQASSVMNLISQIQSLAPPLPGDGSGTNGGYIQFNYTPFVFDTNGLWLEASNEISALGLRLHNTVGGDNYQLLSATNLLNANWNLGEILFYASDGYADFTPVPMTNAMTYYRAHQANPVMEIVNSQDSKELDPTNTSDPGYAGILYIENEGWATNDVTVYYSIGGTAQNGVDYSNLTGVATIPNGQWFAVIDINPTADGLKPNQTVILTLLQNTNYLIDPSRLSATNNLIANPQVYPIASGDAQYPCPNTSTPIYLQAQDPRSLPLTYTILTWPAHGKLTGVPPYMTYTLTNCYEGQDSFTFKVNDGQYDSVPFTVPLSISDTVYANPVTSQTCRGTPVAVTLSGWDNCGETLGYTYSTPASGTLSGAAPNLTYAPTGTNFTGTDSFNYTVFNNCGDFATNTVTITVGDANLYPNPQAVMTGTNRPVNITLTAQDYDQCADSSFAYTITANPAHGTLSNTPPNLVYTPTNNYEGADSFNFTVSDGVWPSLSSDATVTLFVVAGPTNLTAQCVTNGAGILLNWSLDGIVQQMETVGLNIQDFQVYRSTNHGGPYTLVHTTADGNTTSYVDLGATPGDTYYYAVTFIWQDPYTGANYESPFSNEAALTAGCPANAGNALWVDYGPTPQELARWLMGTNPVTVANARYTGASVARGIFGNGSAVGLPTGAPGLPIDAGVILSSGPITNAIGPNDDNGSIASDYGNCPSVLGQPGDADLDKLVDGGGTEDAAVLEFDIVATNSFTLTFQYIYASEEYPEWIGSDGYNDPMAIFVSTNRVGTNWINSITNDIALVPGTTNLPVSVNNINGGCVSDAGGRYDSPTHAQYYVDNCDPYPYLAVPPYAAAAPVYNLQYDGFTTLLSAQKLISANVTNHIKITIADYNDHDYDSAVFIKAQTPCN